MITSTRMYLLSTEPLIKCELRNRYATLKKSHETAKQKTTEIKGFTLNFGGFGPSDWIRTSGLLNPIQKNIAKFAAIRRY